MDVNLLKAISIAGMFHDLGKFAERANAVESGDPDMIQQDYRYAHAYHTEQALQQLFAEERLGKPYGQDEDCTILNLAARHHKPGENIYRTIVAEADRIASGHERAKGDTASNYDTHGREKKSKTPLISIMSRVRLKKYADDAVEDWRYRIREEGFVHGTDVDEHIPPVPAEQYGPKEVQADYRQHWESFVRAVRPGSDFGLDIVDHFSTLLEICRTWQWCLPASTRVEEMPDVSLFDHQKATAALAACLYSYHATTDTMELLPVRDRSVGKYLLFSGDLSGIQKFIYQISSKGAYRALKGRSFYIQLLADQLALTFTEVLDLTPVNILYASGGKFYLLLPNTEDTVRTVTALADEVNRELFSAFNGDLFIRTGHIPMSGEDLTRQSGRTLYQIWDDLTQQLVYQDRSRYAGLAGNHYDLLFGVTDGDIGTCEVCHQAMDKEGKCQACQWMEKVGRKLGQSRFILCSGREQAGWGQPTLRFQFRLHDRTLEKFIWFTDEALRPATGSSVRVLSINDPEFYTVPGQLEGSTVNSAPYFAAGTHSFINRTFDEIADLSNGVKRLGILRMDVDSLGKIFSEGLINYRHETESSHRFHSLGRITTLSHQVSLFFSGVLPAMIRNNTDWAERVTIVYAGGDDLFLLGAWDALPEIALVVADRFAAYTCRNRSFSLSGGMVLTGGKFPVYKSAEMAGEAEQAAKAYVTEWADKQKTRKASFTFLDTSMHWSEFGTVSEFQQKLLVLLAEKENAPLLRRLQDIAASWQKSSEKLNRSAAVDLDSIRRQLAAERWRWGMVYSLARFVERNKDMKSDIDSIQQFILSPVAQTERSGIALLGLLSRWCELRLR